MKKKDKIAIRVLLTLIYFQSKGRNCHSEVRSYIIYKLKTRPPRVHCKKELLGHQPVSSSDQSQVSAKGSGAGQVYSNEK